MSSHHIIRDEQEPPVFVFHLNDNLKELSEILGWSPIVLISPLLKETFERSDTKIDGYLVEEKFNIDRSEKDLVYKESQLANSMLSWLNTKKCSALNVFCNVRFMMGIFQKLKDLSVSIPFIFFTENGKYILKPSSKFKKWYPAKFKIDILNDDIKTIKNLKQGSNGYWVEKEGFVIIEVEGNLVMIKEMKLP